MAISQIPAQMATNALQAIPFSSMIGGPLKACIEAQAMAAQTSWDFIQKVGLNTDPKTGERQAVNVSFSFNQGGRMMQINVPLLTIVPIPYIAINSVDINFKANVSASSSSFSENTQSSSVEAGALLSVRLHGDVPAPSLEYSFDLANWTVFDFATTPTIMLEEVGDKVYWRNTGKTDHFSKDADNNISFVFGEKKIAAEGNIMSLLDKDCVMSAIPSDYCFAYLFWGSKSLVLGPELPAETLTEGCYQGLFGNCTALECSPCLPATNLAESCYYKMFSGCGSLEKAPEHPATELPTDCYGYMFQSCSSLVEVSDIPATKVGSGSCFSMFIECSSLERAPALPAKQLGAFCYQQMFLECRYLEEGPYLPARQLYPGCYEGMFENCSSLRHIKVGFENWGDGSVTAGWAARVPSEGLFECPDGLALHYGEGFIPNGWSVNGAAPAALALDSSNYAML